MQVIKVFDELRENCQIFMNSYQIPGNLIEIHKYTEAGYERHLFLAASVLAKLRTRLSTSL